MKTKVVQVAETLHQADVWRWRNRQIFYKLLSCVRVRIPTLPFWLLRILGEYDKPVQVHYGIAKFLLYSNWRETVALLGNWNVELVPDEERLVGMMKE